MTIRAERVALLCTCLCFLLYLGFTLPLIPVAADDIRMAGVFSLDESVAAQVVRYLYRAGSPAPPSFKYGGGFYYAPLAAAALWGIVGETTDRVFVLALRIFCTVAGMGCLWLTYRIGCSAFDRVTGLVGMFLLCVTPTFLRWSVEGHPDLPQLFWVLGALYCCCLLCRTFRLKWAVLASLFAGLAFGTKYAAGFLLPVVALAVLLPANGDLSLRTGLGRLRDRRYLLALGAIPVAFAAGFAVVNPYALARFGGFVESLLAEMEIMRFGHSLRADTRSTLWLGMFAAIPGKANRVVLAGCLVAGAWGVLKSRRLAADRGVLLIWIGLFLAYLMLAANLRRGRHLLPVLPTALLFVAGGYRTMLFCTTS